MANQTNPIKMLRFIRCAVGDESYGLDMSWVRSIQRTDQLQHDPGEHGRAGWLLSREGNIPVYNLASRFGRPDKGVSAQGRIIVLNPPASFSTPQISAALSTSRPWALSVDRVSQVIQISMERVVPLPTVTANSLSNFFRGVIRLGEELVLFLAPEQLHPDAAPSIDQAATPVASSMPAPKPQATAKASAATSIKKKGRSEKQILLFSTAETLPGERALSFALSITQVPEILNAMPLMPIPGAPPFVMGMVNWRNRPVPVIDLNSRLGLTASALPLSGRTRLLIARSSSDTGAELFVGLIIHSTVRAMRLPLAHKPCQRSVPIEKKLVSGIVDLEKETVAIPNIPQILRFG